jgi:alanine racemase
VKNPRTWVEIDLGKVQANIEIIKRSLSPDTHILAVVKADAYGHGAIAIARTALSSGASMLGVGDSTEALELREAGINAPIIILGAVCDQEIDCIVRNDITPTVHSLERARDISRAAEKTNKRLWVNLMVDTGMGRVGVKPDSALKLAQAICDDPNLELLGVSTHFSTAHFTDQTFTYEQLDKFNTALAELAQAGIRPPVIHAANSAALFSVPEAHFDMVRPGAAIYGIDPGNLAPRGISLSPILEWKTQIVYWKWVEEGTPIGYSKSYRAPKRTIIATLPAGYDDGYNFSFSNTAEVLYKGKRCRVVGNVTMDYIMVDLGEVSDVSVGDEITLLGTDGDAEVGTSELARLMGAPPYVVTSLLGRRVKRIYKDSSGSQLQVGVIGHKKIHARQYEILAIK